MSSEDGPWLDMSAYPDTDPDTVMSPELQSVLHDALVLDTPLPEDTWQQMLAAAVDGMNDDSPEPAPAEHGNDTWTVDGDQDPFVAPIDAGDDLEFDADHGAHDAPFADVVPTTDNDLW